MYCMGKCVVFRKCIVWGNVLYGEMCCMEKCIVWGCARWGIYCNVLNGGMIDALVTINSVIFENEEK